MCVRELQARNFLEVRRGLEPPLPDRADAFTCRFKCRAFYPIKLLTNKNSSLLIKKITDGVTIGKNVNSCSPLTKEEKELTKVPYAIKVLKELKPQ